MPWCSASTATRSHEMGPASDSCSRLYHSFSATCAQQATRRPNSRSWEDSGMAPMIMIVGFRAKFRFVAGADLFCLHNPMFVRRIRVEYEADGQHLLCPIKWLDSFSMRSFTNATTFDDTLPVADGIMELGARVPLEL